MLVLASQSPRRKELLERAGFPVDIRVPGIEEVRRSGEDPEQYVRRLAYEKAHAVSFRPKEIVLGADTVVVCDGRVLEKPAHLSDTSAMLRMLSGRSHDVITGVCLRHGGGAVIDSEITRVWFAELTATEVESYVQSGEPEGKAGGYAIQGLASKFVVRIEGDYSNVVGLPVAMVYRYWRKLVGPNEPG